MTKEEVRQLFKDAGLRATPARIALLGALATAEGPKSVEELHGRIEKGDLVTAYRTLEAFVKAGLAHEVRFKDAVVRFEYADGAHHHHIVCTTCGTVDELPECNVSGMEKRALESSVRFKSINEHALEFFGTCLKCA